MTNNLILLFKFDKHALRAPLHNLLRKFCVFELIGALTDCFYFCVFYEISSIKTTAYFECKYFVLSLILLLKNENIVQRQSANYDILTYRSSNNVQDNTSCGTNYCHFTSLHNPINSTTYVLLN